MEEALSKTKIIEWNIGYSAQYEKILEQVKEYMDGSFIICLLEVVPRNYEKFAEDLKNIANLRYSLDYRKPGKYDGKNRQLGVLAIISLDFEIEDAGVFNRTLFPDRTLWVNLKVNQKVFKAVGFHSITGCSHKTAKSTNFLSMAESIDEFRPDIVVFDANEPNMDHYDVEKMKFFEKNGRGAQVFFNLLLEIGLVDALSVVYDSSKFVEGSPLAVSHKISRGGRAVRYDFIFLRESEIGISNVSYEFEKAINATADHALVIVD